LAEALQGEAMRKHLVVLPLSVLCTILVLAQQAMNNDSVVKLIKAGMSDDVIITTINSSPGTYNTSADALISLKTAGASDKVLSAVLMKAAVTSATPAAGQAVLNSQAPAIQEPETMGKIFFLNPATQALTQLPGEQWKRQVKTSFSTTKTVNVIAGEHSSFRISSHDKIVFVFRPFPDQKDFNAIQGIQIYPFEVNHGERTCIVAEQKGRSHEGNSGVISLQAVKYGASSYALSPSNFHLGPGEYWVHVPGAAGFNDPLITFGMD
jgi:hypothetical protein